MDYIALISFLLAIVAIAYFLLEFIFTGMRDRFYAFVRSLAHR